MNRNGAHCSIVYPTILRVIDPCLDPARTGLLLLHPYGWRVATTPGARGAAAPPIPLASVTSSVWAFVMPTMWET